jgi:hypothetical protein
MAEIVSNAAETLRIFMSPLQRTCAVFEVDRGTNVQNTTLRLGFNR